MKSYFAFTKKEFLEQIRTYKTFILLAVFFIFGMMSPPLAKLMPKMMSSMGVNGMQIIIPEPTYVDAYTQFFKNTTQMGIIAILLVFCGSISQEMTKGTLINMFSKGLSRAVVILSKYTASLVLWTVSFSSAAAINYGYTIYFFGSHPTKNLLFSCFCLWLFGAFILAVIYFTSTFTHGNYGSLFATSGILGILLFISIFPKSIRFNPVSLAANNTLLLTGGVSVGDIRTAVLITSLLIILCLTSALFIFKKKEL